jgi:hypothetical protein
MSEPITIEFVGRVVEGNDGLEAYFDIEGGIAALEPGCSLYASADLQNAALTDEDGSCELYKAADMRRPIFNQQAIADLSVFDDENLQGGILMRMPPTRVKLPPRPRADEEDYERMTSYDKGLLHGGIELWDQIDKLNRAVVFGIDQGEPGGDMTATAVFKRDANGLTLQSLEHRERVSRVIPADTDLAALVYGDDHQWSAEDMAAIRKFVPSATFNKIEPACSFCFQRGCNGECHGDDMMGGGD